MMHPDIVEFKYTYSIFVKLHKFYLKQLKHTFSEASEQF